MTVMAYNLRVLDHHVLSSEMSNNDPADLVAGMPVMESTMTMVGMIICSEGHPVYYGTCSLVCIFNFQL